MNNKEQQQVQYLNFADSCDVSIEREHGLLHRLYVRTHTHTHTHNNNHHYSKKVREGYESY